jgi:translation initiation factor 1
MSLVFNDFNSMLSELDSSITNEYTNIVHLRKKMRNGKKCVTIIEGLDIDEGGVKKLLQELRKKFSTNGAIFYDDEKPVIQVQGDKITEIQKYLVENDYCETNNIRTHKF